MSTITMNEVMNNAAAYMMGVQRLGNIDTDNGIYGPDAPDMSTVCEHTTMHEIGTIEEPATLVVRHVLQARYYGVLVLR